MFKGMAKFKVVNNAIFYKNARYEMGDEIELSKEEAKSFEGIVEPIKGKAGKEEVAEVEADEVEIEEAEAEAPVEAPKKGNKGKGRKGKK